jgi:hypothetical protein
LPRPTVLTLNLLPLTVVQLMLVCVLLHDFRATGEPCCLPRRDIRLPRAVNGAELLRGPVVAISPTDVRVDGSVVDGGARLADRLLILKNDYPRLHPGQTFDGRVLVSADRDIPWRRLRKVLAAAEAHDYRIIDLVVVDGSPRAGGL